MCRNLAPTCLLLLGEPNVFRPDGLDRVFAAFTNTAVGTLSYIRGDVFFLENTSTPVRQHTSTRCVNGKQISLVALREYGRSFGPDLARQARKKSV